jgi:hypothetical protein
MSIVWILLVAAGAIALAAGFGVDRTGHAQRLDDALRRFYSREWRSFLLSVGFHERAVSDRDSGCWIVNHDRAGLASSLMHSVRSGPCRARWHSRCFTS